MELPKNTGMNKYAIKRIDSKQQLYRPIYALSLVKLETLQIYIKTLLKTGFFSPPKSSASAFILFDQKPHGKICLYIYYWTFNNFIIKNWYVVSIGESLNWLR